MVELVGAHHLRVVPVAENLRHHPFHVVEVLLGLKRVVNAVISLLVEFGVRNIWIVLIMRATGGLDKAVRHERASGNDGVHDSVFDQVSDD